MKYILGIESSCDETGIAIYSPQQGLVSHRLYSQRLMHEEYGGVVPELAARDHIQKILPLVKEVITEADLSLRDINGIAYTKGPGLVGALLVGATFAKSLGMVLGIPVVGVHHMEAHLLAPLLEDNAPSFPAVALLISGGHTLLVEVSRIGKYRILGESLDDAVGEAFDKTAKLLGLPYPGGPVLEKLALQGNAKRFHFPRPMTDRPGLDFSFSGLKTAVSVLSKANKMDLQTQADIAWAFQDAATDTLVIKAQRALQQTGLKTLIVAGGVGANQTLRQKLNKMADEIDVKIFYPRLEFCTDNGAMVAYAGYERLRRGKREDLAIEVFPRWSLEEIGG